MTRFAAALMLALAPVAPAEAQPPRAIEARTLQQRVEALFAHAAPGARFGMVVADETGAELVAVAPDARFIPASNTKLFTTAASLARSVLMECSILCDCQVSALLIHGGHPSGASSLGFSGTSTMTSSV